MKLHWLDIMTLAIYSVGMVLMGFYFARKNKNTEEYFLGGRSFSGWIIGFSLVATSISSVTFIAYPGDAFKTTWIRYLPNFALPFCVLFASHFFLPFYRRTPTTSAYEYLETRFGPGIRVYAAVSFIISQLTRLAIILLLVSILVNEMTGLDLSLSILIAGLFVAVYTIVGGIDAVIWTDVVQTFVLFAGGVFCLILIILKLPDGLSQIIEVGLEQSKLSFYELSNGSFKPLNWDISLSEKTYTMLFILGIFSWLSEYSSNQNVVQRYCASRNIHEARKAMWVCVFSSLPIWAFYMFLGTALFVFFQQFPTTGAQEMLDGTQKADQILPYFIMNYMPPGIRGFVIAAALAAAMSSLDSSINAISAIGVVDIYKRHLVKNRVDKHYLIVAWCIAVLASIFMIIGALILAASQTKTLRDVTIVLSSILGSGLLGIYMLGFLTKKGDARSVTVGIVFTILFTLWTILAEKKILPEFLKLPFDAYYTVIVGNILMFIFGYFSSYVIPQKKRNLDNLTVWTQDGKVID